VPGSVLSCPEQLAASRLHLRYCAVEVFLVPQTKPEVCNPSLGTRHICLAWIRVQRNCVLTAGRSEKDQFRTFAKELFHPENGLVELKRTIKVSDNEMDMR